MKLLNQFSSLPRRMIEQQTERNVHNNTHEHDRVKWATYAPFMQSHRTVQVVSICIKTFLLSLAYST